MSTTTQEPKKVRFTKDYLDLEVGLAYRAGTVLERQPTGQYALPNARLGDWCVAGLPRLHDYEVIE